MFTTHSPVLNAIVLSEAQGEFATGVAVVTAVRDDGRPVGMTINSFTSVSLTPPLLSWCISRRASNYQVLAVTRHFCIAVLTDDQADLTRHLPAAANKDSTASAATAPHLRSRVPPCRGTRPGSL